MLLGCPRLKYHLIEIIVGLGHLYFPTLVIFSKDISRLKVSYSIDHVTQSLVKYSFLAANTQVIIYKSETNYFELRFSA